MRSVGLRLQIVLSLVGLMALAFVPLYFAIASVTHLTLLSAREESARALGRAVAAHVADVRSRDATGLERVLESHVGRGGVDAICVYRPDGSREACAGDAQEIPLMTAPPTPAGESVTTVRGATGRALDVVVPSDLGAIVARLKTDENADRSAPLVRLVGGYMIVIALALAFLAYFGLTRLIVRPVEALSRAADKVASGARRIEVPRSGARELLELSSSVETMTTRLVLEEEKLKKKVDELVLAQKHLQDAQAQVVRSERLASVGRLSAGLAHEIGNPITAIMGMLDLMVEGDLPAEEAADFLVRMRKETDRIHHVLRDLLDFSRPEEAGSGGEDVVTDSDVGTVALDAIALAKPQRAFKHVTLTLVCEEPARARIAPRRLEQVLINLILNAGDALSQQAQGAVTVRVTQSADHVELEVEDDGPGVNADVRARIFEPFVTTKDVGKGTGLGLAVCRGIIEASGGAISLDPDHVQGARFRIRLRSIPSTE